MIITTANQNGQPTFETTDRGTAYYLRMDVLGRWELTSQRLALRAARMGGMVRHFDTLEAVSAHVRALRGIDLLAGDTALAA